VGTKLDDVGRELLRIANAFCQPLLGISTSDRERDREWRKWTREHAPDLLDRLRHVLQRAPSPEDVAGLRDLLGEHVLAIARGEIAGDIVAAILDRYLTWSQANLARNRFCERHVEPRKRQTETARPPDVREAAAPVSTVPSRHPASDESWVATFLANAATAPEKGVESWAAAAGVSRAKVYRYAKAGKKSSALVEQALVSNPRSPRGLHRGTDRRRNPGRCKFRSDDDDERDAP
jgi:hypothetical protein